jgi:hypothetical protein
MVKLHIISVVTHSKYYFPYLLKSITKHNNELKTLGFGTKWKGFNYRLKLIKQELLKLPKDDIVCIIDGYDVLCVRDLNDMIDNFIKIKEREKCKIVGGHDYIPSKFVKLYCTLYFTRSLTRTTINAGTYIGNVEDLLNMFNILNSIDNNNLSDDQVLLNKYNKLYPGYIYCDINAELFLTVGGAFIDVNKYITIKNNNIVQYMNNKPYFIHAAGSGYLDNIIIRLGYEYDMNNMISKKVKEDFYIKSYKVIIEIINRNRFNIIKIILIIIIFAIYYNKLNELKNLCLNYNIGELYLEYKIL